MHCVEAGWSSLVDWREDDWYGGEAGFWRMLKADWMVGGVEHWRWRLVVVDWREDDWYGVEAGFWRMLKADWMVGVVEHWKLQLGGGSKEDD